MQYVSMSERFSVSDEGCMSSQMLTLAAVKMPQRMLPSSTQLPIIMAVGNMVAGRALQEIFKKFTGRYNVEAGRERGPHPGVKIPVLARLRLRPTRHDVVYSSS